MTRCTGTWGVSGKVIPQIKGRAHQCHQGRIDAALLLNSVANHAIADTCASGGETQLLRIAVDAMHTCGLAMAVQALATALLGAS